MKQNGGIKYKPTQLNQDFFFYKVTKNMHWRKGVTDGTGKNGRLCVGE